MGFWITKKFKMPSEWEEISPRQMIGIAMLGDKCYSNHHALSLITGLPQRITRHIHPYHAFSLVESMHFLEECPEADRFFIPSITIRNRLLKIPTLRTTTYMLPRPRLASMAFGQFMFVDTHFVDFIRDKQLTDIYKFIGALLMLPDEKFTEKSEKILEQRAILAHRIPPLTIMALMANYDLVRKWLSTRYPIVFNDASTRKIINPDLLPVIDDPEIINNCKNTRGWLGVFENIVGDDITNEMLYAQTSVNRIMRFLTTKIKQNAKR